jgi:hypothetical protein
MRAILATIPHPGNLFAGSSSGGAVFDTEGLQAAPSPVGVSDPRVLEAVGSVPRAAFVPPELAEQANLGSSSGCSCRRA